MQAKNKVKKIGCFGHLFQWIFFLFNILFMTILYLSHKAFTIPPSESMYYSFFGLTYGLWLGLNILFLILWLIFKRWIFLTFQILILVLCWSSIKTYFPMHVSFFGDKHPSNTIKVMSYNVDALQSLRGEQARQNPIFDYIKEQEADIICLQEMSLTLENTNHNGIITYDEVKEIFAEYPFIHYQTNFISGKERSGLMTLSKYEIKSSKGIELWSTFNGACVSELDIEGKNIYVANLHLESNRITEADRKLYRDFFKNTNKENSKKMEENIKERMSRGYLLREKQVKIINSELEKLPAEYLFVCGDFNDTPISYTHHQLVNENNLLDSFVENGFGFGITFREKLFPFRLDYILHSSNTKVYDFKIDKVEYSDHYPISAYFSIE